MTYTKEHLKTSTFHVVNEEYELIHIYVKINNNPYSMIQFYRPSSTHNVTNFIDRIEHIMCDNKRRNNTFIIIGDTNIDITSEETNATTQEYMRRLQSLNLKQIIQSPTTMYKSTLDHIWISNKHTNHNSYVRTTYYSDHMPLLLDIEF